MKLKSLSSPQWDSHGIARLDERGERKVVTDFFGSESSPGPPVLVFESVWAEKASKTLKKKKPRKII